jgi:RNA polymerase sigma-70 factor (ECF subfamily)
VVADRAGFEGFYREHLTRVVRACTLVTLDPVAAEDVAAEAFARLWSHWGQIHDEDHAGGYVFKTAMRLCAKRGAKARREVIGEVADRPGTDELGRSDDRAEVFAALGGLSVRQRQAVVLRDWAGYPTDEVASMLGMRESTVRVHLSRGREALRRSLSVEERER